MVALNTLKYFWRLRTPEESAADVGRLIRHYLTSWKRERVLLVGYSFGADVLPFITNRLPPELRARVISVSMLGLELNASFEIHVTGWVPGVDTGSAPIKPELAKMQGVNALCLYGADERHDPCPMLAGGSLRARQIGGGHHFGGDYEALAAAILAPIGSGAAGERPSR